ncbi:hypothetical protein pEaSNUABM34_00039 [Erwinia phage pEa_SNUABM_34]|nr:hypothetical protein pEaSNUABM34_00039 [Erwinia phage pEa_SNUABM_34]QYW05054.1 hypothetical protein pEaSNUABM21_00040 [Erwinia phage pEa_SNUABM_21]
MSDINQLRRNWLQSMDVPEELVDKVCGTDIEQQDLFESLSAQQQRKVTIGLALLHLQVPDEIRFDLLTNHLDETERLVKEQFEELAARLVNQVTQTGSPEKQSMTGGVRLAMLMNILGFDDTTLHGIMSNPSLMRQAGLVAMTGLQDMGQKIQQLYDGNKSNEPK